MESLVEVEDFPGRLLHVAALWDNAELLEDLLHNGDELECIEATDSWGRTPLHAAATNAGSRCLRILLQAGANCDAAAGPRAVGRTPLHVSAEHGHGENVALLLEHGASLLVRDTLGLTPLDLAEKGEHADCMHILTEAAARQEQARMESLKQLSEACVVGDDSAVRQLLSSLKPTLGHVAAIVNATGGSGDSAGLSNNTLLFKASEYGHAEIVRMLLDCGADGRGHPVTRHSPLFIAAYNGKRDVVEMLLKRFPELVHTLTVEKWSPLHAACINGHAALFEMMLKFPYPAEVMKRYRDKSDKWEYEAAFDINQADVSGQTLLYLAVCVCSTKIAELLLAYRVRARLHTKGQQQQHQQQQRGPEGRLSPGFTSSKDDQGVEALNPRKTNRVLGIQALISKLRGSTTSDESESMQMSLAEDEVWLNPIDIDYYSNHGSETALQFCIKRKEYTLASKLLLAGANPNLPILSADVAHTNVGEDAQVTGTGTCLMEACRNKDSPMIDLLLKFSARDDDCKALQVATEVGDELVISKLLSLKANQDPEGTINKKGIAELNGTLAKGIAASLAYSSIFPSIAVMINWHNQGGCLTFIKEQFLIDACVRLNPKLKLSPKFQTSVVHSITRLDISSNELTELPECIWSCQSLRSLNAAQNKLEKLPSRIHKNIGLSALRSSSTSLYSCPWLEEVQLQDNRLETLPSALFSLKNLACLDVSNNKLSSLPYEVWTAPSLKDLNASFNMLAELPYSRTVESRQQKQSYQHQTSESHSSNSIVSDASDSSDLFLAEMEEKLSTTSLSELQEHSKCVQKEEVAHINLLSSVDVVDKSGVDDSEIKEGRSSLSSLNLSHNAFTVAPKSLACLAPNLSRLSMAYNAIQHFGSVSNYPQSLKHLDLSYNQVRFWPGDEEALSSTDSVCYAPESDVADPMPSVPEEGQKIPRLQKHSFTRTNMCAHKKHYRLENLRTLILANNCLSVINFYSADFNMQLGEENSEGANSTTSHSKTHQHILFPALSMLDVNSNRIATIPPTICELVNLSVLNLSDNIKISDLPPQMGLLYKLWNLNTAGCNLQEPLQTMVASKSYKTADVIGYLRSVLENAKRYARLKLMVVGIQGIGKTTLLELLRQEGGHFKRKTQEHWAKRMGNRNINMKTGKGVSISTVGIDIGDWTFEKRVERGQPPTHGPVTFRTWDFGGQTEYYSTHLYFLSKRSLYLVLWKITDGEKGVNEIQQWLINIQARAPNSPVIIVGTHYDMAKEEFAPSFTDYLQHRIRDRFINVTDPEKCGLPRVLDSIEVSCRSRHNMRLLANLLYDTAFSLRSPGSKMRLLDQKIPATYLALEDLVGVMAAEIKSQGHDPVLNQEQYEEMVHAELAARFSLRFRDAAELNQATKFLHENGVLLHYDDATLRDLYFLDPQWLCDVLSHVVTIREINPFARNGVMRLEDLRHVFKSSTAVSVSAKSYIVNLLNKFEVALTWDSRTLLIPSLLPTEVQMRSGIPGADMRVKIAVRTRGWGFRGRRSLGGSAAAMASAMHEARSRSVPSRNLIKGGAKLSARSNLPELASPEPKEVTLSKSCESEHCIHRLILVSYFPSGFWSRLLTRVLADDSVVEVIRSYFIVPQEASQDACLAKLFVDHKPEWVCWQTGLELRYMDCTLFSMKQVLSRNDYSRVKLVMNQDGTWAEVDTRGSVILEITLPQETVVFKRPVREAKRADPIGYQTLALDPSPKSVCQLLALAVEHVDTLLEDWYPSLGTRFLHTSEGKMLVTRLVPCPRCLCETADRSENGTNAQSWKDWSFLPDHLQRERRGEAGEDAVRGSQESAASDRDSGVGHDSPQEPSRLALVMMQNGGRKADDDRVFAFMVEDLILHAFEGRSPSCPAHGDLHLGQIAPDTIFLDLEERFRITSDSLKQGDLIGRGAFGFVYESIYSVRGGTSRRVAIKMLQPIDPGPNARESTQAAFRANRSKWERDPLQYTCKAYCTARQELSILVLLRHAHIVPLVGICTNPLSVVLELAPQGALDQRLRHYRRSGDKLSPRCVQIIVLQVARALEYLHQHHIIYRDLKSENVLVWQLPEPFATKRADEVLVKLADYGISRPTLPTGAKGFGGTEGFMAPEIVRFNGEEEYTEKVDSFSFGMFIYELLTLHQPFAGYDTVKELILEGQRPPISIRELIYPTYLLDLMVVCWAQQPRDRPSSSQLVSISSAPEFAHMLDAVRLHHGVCNAWALVPSGPGAAGEGTAAAASKACLWMAFISAFEERPRLHVLEAGPFGFQEHISLQAALSHSVTCMCVINDCSVWIGDNLGSVHAYSASTFEQLFSYKMEEDESSAIGSIHFVSEIQRACVAMQNGRMFLCCTDVVPSGPMGCEGTFLITELGSASCIHSVTSIKLDTAGAKVEIWCGESHGDVSVFTVRDGIVTSQEVINHNNPVVEGVEVLQVVSDRSHKSSQPFIWTFVYPGCQIYQWQGRVIRNKLDCSKLVPSSESLKTIAIDEHFSPGRCQIVTMTVFEQKLMVGTSWGCLIVADAYSMRPISVFRPYSEEIQALFAVRTVRSKDPLFISLGKGFRSLIRRFVADRRPQSTEAAVDDDDTYTVSALMWRSDDWLCD